ncbi:MAG: DUF11 domain-containing protein, partial [Anaerolineales bacterium]|nr:DUF11 domain-containing protein [Anaerolineales bacterium]
MKRFVALCLAILMPILGLTMLVHNIKAAPQLASGTVPEAPDANSLSLAAAWQATASAETTFGLTFTIGNSSVYTFHNLLLTATVPSNATHISGGELVGDEVRYELAQLAPGCCTEVTFYFSASQPIGTSGYQLTAQTDRGGLTAVTDTLEDNWNNWSWDTNASMSSSQSHAGSNSLAVRHTGGFGGLFLHGDNGIDTDDLVAVRLWVHGGNSGGQNLGLKLERPDGSFTTEQIIAPTANTWTEFTFPLSAFGVVTDVHGIVIQSRQQGAQPIYYVDEVALLPQTGAQGVATTNILLPGLQINKSGPATAAMGAPVVYSVAVNNPGPGTATNVVITDVVPAGATYLSGGTLNGNVVSWTIPSLAEGVTSTVQFTVSATQTITNSDYAVTAAGGFSATGSTSVTTLITPPQLSISKRGPESVVVGNPIIYALRVTNNGTTPATNIVVTDTLPANTSYVSGGTLNGNVVTWAAPTLAAGQVVTLTLRVLPDEPTSFPATVVNNDYAVRADGGYSAVGQNAVTTRVLGTQLSLSKEAPATIDLGEVLTYTLVITNSGDLTATNIMLTDLLPDGAVYQAGGNFDGTTVSFAIPLVPPNTTVIRQFSILPDEDEAPFLGTLQNHTYGLTSGQGDIITGT